MPEISHEQNKNKTEEVNTMTESPEAADSVHAPGKPVRDLSTKSEFVIGLCKSLKNANQYRAGMIEKIKNKLGNHTIYFRKKQ